MMVFLLNSESSQLTRDEIAENVRVVRYEYGLTEEESGKLKDVLHECKSVTECLEVLEAKLMEFTMAKGRPSRKEFEEVNTRGFSDISA